MMDLVDPHLDIGLVTGDADAARAFYTEVLQLEALPSRDLPAGRRQHRFRFGGQLIKLLELPETPPSQPVSTRR